MDYGYQSCMYMHMYISCNYMYISCYHVTMSHTVRVASFYYQNLSNLLPPRNSSYQLISPVVSAITNCRSCPVTDLEEDVIVQFNNIQVIIKMTIEDYER